MYPPPLYERVTIHCYVALYTHPYGRFWFLCPQPRARGQLRILPVRCHSSWSSGSLLVPSGLILQAKRGRDIVCQSIACDSCLWHFSRDITCVRLDDSGNKCSALGIRACGRIMVQPPSKHHKPTFHVAQFYPRTVRVHLSEIIVRVYLSLFLHALDSVVHRAGSHEWINSCERG